MKELHLRYVLPTGCTKNIVFKYTDSQVADLEDLQFFLEHEHNIAATISKLADLALSGSCTVLYDDGFMQTTGQLTYTK